MGKRALEIKSEDISATAIINGAGDGIRTRTNSLEGYCASH